MRQDYVSFFERELHFRRMMVYPPFTSLANVIVRAHESRKRDSIFAELSEYFSPH